MVRPYICSTLRACVLTDILTVLPIQPKKKRKVTNCHVALEIPIPNRMNAYNSRAEITTFLLPNLPISHPETGRESNEPTGNAKRTIPSSLSEKFNFCLMVGMREAQEEKQSPSMKNS